MICVIVKCARQAASAILAVACIALTTAAPAAAGIYDASGVEAKAQAADAVTAKHKALAEAQAKTLRAILERLTRSSDHSRLPQPTAEQAEKLLNGISVEREITSPTTYDARLTLRFDPAGVQQILRDAGLRFTERQAPATLIVPIYKEGESIAVAEQNPALEGWRGLDLTGGLAPVKLPTGNIAEQGVDLATLVALTPEAVASLRHLYEAEYVLVNVCESDEAKKTLLCTLEGEGPGGAVNFSEQFANADDPAAAAQAAARTFLAKLEESWKENGPNELPGVRDGLVVEVYAPFSTLAEWQSLRARLTTLPGLGDLEVLSLNARGALLTLFYSGTMEDLVGAMTVANIEIFDTGSQIEIRAY